MEMTRDMKVHIGVEDEFDSRDKLWHDVDVNDDDDDDDGGGGGGGGVVAVVAVRKQMMWMEFDIRSTGRTEKLTSLDGDDDAEDELL